MTNSLKCNLDSKTRWSGKYQGVVCGININPDPNIPPTPQSGLITLTLEQISPGVYKQSTIVPFVPEPVILYGIAYINASGIPVLEMAFPGNDTSLIYSAVKVNRKCKVIKFNSPLDGNPPGAGQTLSFVIYKRIC